ncbi:MAG: hypothetical protein PHV82_16925 [Victivallaceae bacterium]|nr:hypothetical protein [Victivallaceae bacterium]
MSIRKKHMTRHYTLVEVMMAMGIFLIMMTIMMQFFTSAQEIWNNSSKRNMLYADARVSMNLMTREIQSMLYRNDDTDGSGIYPFWYEWTDLDASLGGETVPTEVKTYFKDNDELPEKTSGDSYLTALNFISATDLKPIEKGSDVCEIRYRFIPVYCNGTPNSINDIKGGKLQRSCIAEYKADGTLTDTTAYNFAECYYRGINPGTGTSGDPGYPYDKRVLNIWNASDFDTVINGVYSLNFTCYRWNSGLASYEPMDQDEHNVEGGSITGYNLATGTPYPVAIRIDMKLLDPKDLKKLVFAICQGDTKQVNILKQKIRTFSKVIYLGKRED